MNSAKQPVLRRRVVVTGIGADAFCAALRGGVSGVGKITLFDAQEFGCQIAAEVKNHSPENLLPPRELRRVGRAVPLMLAATREALGGAGLCWERQSVAEKQSGA